MEAPSETPVPELTASRQGESETSTEPANPLPDAAPAGLTGPVEPIGPVGVVGQVLSAAAQEIVRVVRPEAAVAVAAEFGFPLALAVAVFGFLLIQGYVDRRDPKLRMAPQTVHETTMQFKLEEQL